MTTVQDPSPVETPPVPPVVDEPQPTQTVSYETHRKLLGEKKKVQEERDAFALEKAEREKKLMEERGEFQKLAELAKTEVDSLKAKLQEVESGRLAAKKANALLKALDHGIPEKFYGFLPMDEVLVDPETGEVNAMSVAKAADNFRKNFPELIVSKTNAKFPNNAPQGSAVSTISREEWLKLDHLEMVKWKPHQVI